MPQFSQFPLPIGKTRLFGSIIVAFFIGFFIFLGSTNSGWFTLSRQIYFLFGVIAGFLLGVCETRIVIPKLANNTETLVWQVVPIGTALFGIPLLIAIAFFGVSEYLPFGLYAFFPAIPATGATSGWYFNKFEKENKVRVFMFYYGFKYLKEPNPEASDRFFYFLRDVASKDPSPFWGHIGYSKVFMDQLEEKRKIDLSTREELLKILKTMNKYRIIGLVGFSLFLVSISILFILLFGSAFGCIHLNFKITDVLGPASGIILFSFFIGFFVLTKTFQRRISRLLTNIDRDKLAST
jgi:O-antigen/teichoic acid export membrane protein